MIPEEAQSPAFAHPGIFYGFFFPISEVDTTCSLPCTVILRLKPSPGKGEQQTQMLPLVVGAMLLAMPRISVTEPVLGGGMEW